MAEVDIDPFGEHNKTEEPTWEPTREQKTSFGGRSHTSVLHKEYLVGKYMN